MRTTKTIDDDIATAPKKPKPYRLKPESLGEISAGYDLAKSLPLADHLEEEGILMPDESAT